MSVIRGIQRERSLQRGAYFSDDYFSLNQLSSFGHQIHDIYSLKPKNILEVGIGNGFVSTFLKMAGFEVKTVDINPSLNPDIVASIEELPIILKNQKYDLLVCCEVLEHLPFSEFENSIQIFKNIGSRLYLTLPVYNKVFGFGGYIKLPMGFMRYLNFCISLPNTKILDKEHYWEVGSKKQTSKQSLREIISKYYSHTHYNVYDLNPKHIKFVSY